MDYNTVTTEPIGFRGYWLSYRFSDAMQIHIGQNKVPGSREWLVSSMDALGPDRSLATTFFKPSLSQGSGSRASRSATSARRSPTFSVTMRP